ncbi:MAG: hypothetical protein ACTHMT_12865 [Verrucomicrobiota bacterium]
MASHYSTDKEAPLDLRKWRPLPLICMVLGGIGVLIGFLMPSLRERFAFSWLTSYMFYLSLVLGAFFMVLAHHLFDASWSVSIRRINEHMACLAPIMAVLFIPIYVYRKTLYEWMDIPRHTDHALDAKYPLFTDSGFLLVAVICFVLWTYFTWRLRANSLAQDKDGLAVQTRRMRVLSSFGVVVFGLSVTLAAIMWIKGLQYHWFSTMFGVWYFAGSAWLVIATDYFIAMLLKRMGPLREVAGQTQFYFLGSLLLAFTVFYAYITFAQYFIIWNANIPEETFWYVLRERGTWFDISQVIIFGHFFIPFLLLLRIDVKLIFPIMTGLTAWAWLMHYIDMQFNIMPAASFAKEGFSPHLLDVACLLFMGGLLSKIWMIWYFKHPPYPQKDPRIAETMGVYVAPIAAPRRVDAEGNAA